MRVSVRDAPRGGGEEDNVDLRLALRHVRPQRLPGRGDDADGWAGLRRPCCQVVQSPGQGESQCLEQQPWQHHHIFHII